MIISISSIFFVQSLNHSNFVKNDTKQNWKKIWKIFLLFISIVSLLVINFVDGQKILLIWWLLLYDYSSVYGCILIIRSNNFLLKNLPGSY